MNFDTLEVYVLKDSQKTIFLLEELSSQTGMSVSLEEALRDLSGAMHENILKSIKSNLLAAKRDNTCLPKLDTDLAELLKPDFSTLLKSNYELIQRVSSELITYSIAYPFRDPATKIVFFASSPYAKPPSIIDRGKWKGRAILEVRAEISSFPGVFVTRQFSYV